MKGLRLVYMGSVLCFLYIPIFILVLFSFNKATFSTDWEGFSLQWYTKLFQNQDLLEVTLNSLWLAISSASLSTVFSAVLAILFFRFRLPAQSFLKGTLYSLLMAPDLVLGISLLILFLAIGLDLGYLSLLIAHITFCIPFCFLTIAARMQSFDPSILEAALDLGASQFQTYTRILFPILKPALLSAWMLAFTLSMDDVIVSFFVSGPSYEVLPLKIYSMVRFGVKPEVNALCSLLLLMTLVLLFLSHRLINSKEVR